MVADHFRRGELRLILALPEPWTEAQRSDFLAAVEKLHEVGVAPGDVRITNALLATWPPDATKPGGVIDEAMIEKLFVKYPPNEPELRQRAYAEGYKKGEQDGRTATLAPFASPGGMIDQHPKPVFDLSPLADAQPDGWHQPATLDHTCANCGEGLKDCDRHGCGGAKPAGFRFGARPNVEEDASAILKPLAETQNPHADEGKAGSYPTEALDFGEPDSGGPHYLGEPADCVDPRCILRHKEDTTHVFDAEQIDEMIADGDLCGNMNCVDYHYTNDGSGHRKERK